MRKIKITALILAVLMVMAAFAGCAGKADVEELANKLDEHLNEAAANQEKTDEKLSELADLIAGLTNSQTQIKDDQQAVLDAIKDLTDKVTNVENTDKVDTTLEAAKTVYTTKLNEYKLTCELNKTDYAPADYQEVITALTNAINAIAAATTEADAKAAFEAAEKVYNDKATVVTKLVGFYNKFINNVTKDSKEDIAALRVALYGDNETDSILKVAYGATVNKTSGAITGTLPATVTAYGADKIHLVNQLHAIVKAYDYLVGTDFGALVSDATSKITAIGKVTLDPAKLDAISRAEAAVRAVQKAVKGTAAADVHAAYLADSNVNLITNLADLTAATAKREALTVAKAMYSVRMGTAGTGGTMVSAFTKYTALTTKVDYKKVAVYEEINTKLAAWAAEYNVDAENIAWIVTNVDGVDFAAYAADNHAVALTVKAAENFKAIADRIVALGKTTELKTAAFAEYDAIAKAIDTWKKLQKADANNKDPLLRDAVNLSDYNFARILVQYGIFEDKTAAVDANKADIDLTVDATTALAALKADNNGTTKNMYVGVYGFEGDVLTFFTDTYNDAADDAKAINAAIAGVKVDEARSILDLININGYWTVDAAGKYTKLPAITAVSGDIDTVAEFYLTYKQEAYDLSYMINEQALNDKIAAVEKKIADQKKIAVELIATIDALIAEMKEDMVDIQLNDNAGDDVSVYDIFMGTNTDAADAGYKYLDLSYAADVKAAYQTYLDAIVAAGINGMKEFVLVEGTTTGEMKFVDIFDNARTGVLNDMREDITALEKEAAALKNLYDNIAKANKGYAFTAATLQHKDYTALPNKLVKSVALIATSSQEFTENGSKVTKYKYNYIKASEMSKVGANWTGDWTKDNVYTKHADAASPKEVLDAADTNYKAFMKHNNNKTYDDVETRMTANKPLELIYLKNAVLYQLKDFDLANKDQLIATLLSDSVDTLQAVKNLVDNIYQADNVAFTACGIGSYKIPAIPAAADMQ